MRRLAILCIGLAYVSACSSGKKSPLRSAPPPPSAPVAGPSLPGALPLPPAPAAEPVPIVMPVTLALSQPASTPLTPAELSSFQAFVQAQESRNTFAPDTYIFEFAKDERDLSSGQANILRQLRDPALCSTTNDFEDAKVDSFGAGTIYSYALKQGFDGTRCTLKYATNSLMKGRIESYDPETRKVTLQGPINEAKQLLPIDLATRNELGFSLYRSSMSGQLASEQQGNVAETHRRVNVVTEVEAANEPAYRADIDAEIYSVNTHSEVGSVTDVQLALNLRLTSTQLAAPVVFSLLTSVESTNGIVNTSTMQGYLNRTALSAADLQSLVRSKFLRRHIDRLGAPNEPLTDPGN